MRGQENDRVKRRESYVKDFKEIKIGKINLTKGKGELALQALEIPGNESIEFRLLMLEKVQYPLITTLFLIPYPQKHLLRDDLLLS